jgi:acyl-CoA hydrolase/GNAT superfamily N-acetyltransferase
MSTNETLTWRKRLAPPEQALARIEPGMSIFIGTGAAEPGTLLNDMLQSRETHLSDLELIQIVSMGNAICRKQIASARYRLKTFYSGWVASEAITAGRVDLIPCRFSRIPQLIARGQIAIDAAIVQVAPPTESGYCSLGIAVDAARQAMDKATVVIGEVNPWMPQTFGDTFVPISDFDCLVEGHKPPLTFDRWPVAPVYERVAANMAGVIEDGSCLGFSIGPLFEALGSHLVRKRHLGIHSPFFTDALMDLVRSGAVSNRHKQIYRGKCLASYALGTNDLMRWLDRNPLVEFQGLDKVFDPLQIGRNPKFVAILPARRVDLSGRVALHADKGSVTAGPGEAADFINGAEISTGGLTLFGLPSRNLGNTPNICLSVEDMPNQLNLKESVDMVVTEYGTANLRGRTVRERAQALIEIAHPEDRPDLVAQAKAANILFPDQIFLADSAHLYPSEIDTRHTFKNDIAVRFRAIRPSDEEGMRRLFYRFSDQAVYYRFFSPIKVMPHAKMQTYVNIDYRRVLSIVGLVGAPGEGRIVAEARFVCHGDRPYGDVAFVVDEEHQGLGMATFMYRMLIRLARERGLQGFTADVLASNKAMLKVFEKGGESVTSVLEDGVYALTIPFSNQGANGPAS